MSLYGYVAAAVGRRRATSHKDVVTWRYTVGRPAAWTVSGVDVEAPR